MKTPIYDFLSQYNKNDISRLHMPGHKGFDFLGCEHLDITEIQGADDLYNPSSIIFESEKNAAKVFDTGATFYSCEGSSLSIRTMIYTALLSRKKKNKKIIAVRNSHKSFISACAILDIDIVWIYPENSNGICAGTVTSYEVEECLKNNTDAFALFLTSPNYIGEMTDISCISDVCKKYEVSLLVDNAHGAYLKFCNMHPIHLGADICCDSAHKTLPVLTGGAYLHVSKDNVSRYSPYIKKGLALFGSTSPSYLILASLDLCNKYLNNNYSAELKKCINKVKYLKEEITKKGIKIIDGEPLKITMCCDGTKAKDILNKSNVECEYYDKNVLVLMFSPQNKEADYTRIINSLNDIKFSRCDNPPPVIMPGIKKMSVRDAYFSEFETVNSKDALNRICAISAISCPPAIPIAVSGELITQNIIDNLDYYGIDKVDVVKKYAD